ncbi:MAG TPA: hypothetical protein VKU41_22115 [Polyangiaceae bacterium]|nr:hypothetical protein [Polyangiaceae bacterium]
MSAHPDKGEGESSSLPPQASGPAKPSVRAPPPLPTRGATSRPPPLPAARSQPPPAVAAAAAPVQAHPAEASPPRASAGHEVRLHVAIKASVRDASLFIVRPLAEGQRPPPGMREAFLVMLDDGVAPPHEQPRPRGDPPNNSNGGHPS